ncbi:uncharacterized protein LOC120754676 isoform X2 [Hirundo rustica]|nr:uncharacterized protein LOC120754676 isoform X2 [Hirundo rustica]XP_039924473.1 uncharacterized protein LOC120754676 isoform X2 [Hirundo rustica]XP_058277199.1 uncharacterized protein LOC120754676 isoform X2 [Hirundo rustica]
MSQDRAPWPAPDRGTTQGGMSKTSPEGSLGPWPKFFWRVSGTGPPCRGASPAGKCSQPKIKAGVQARDCFSGPELHGALDDSCSLPATFLGVFCRSQLAGNAGLEEAGSPRKATSTSCPWGVQGRSELNTHPRDGRQAARTAPAQARLKGCPQLLGQGLLCTGMGRCFTPHGGHREPRGAPRSSWHCLGTGGSGHPQRGSDGDSRFPPPGAPPRLPGSQLEADEEVMESFCRCPSDARGVSPAPLQPEASSLPHQLVPRKENTLFQVFPVSSCKEFRQKTAGNSCKFKGRRRRSTSKGERLQKPFLQLIIISNSPVRRDLWGIPGCCPEPI